MWSVLTGRLVGAVVGTSAPSLSWTNGSGIGETLTRASPPRSMWVCSAPG